jgi:hypothetical protein
VWDALLVVDAYSVDRWFLVSGMQMKGGLSNEEGVVTQDVAPN